MIIIRIRIVTVMTKMKLLPSLNTTAEKAEAGLTEHRP
jgi:hypothetical protein